MARTGARSRTAQTPLQPTAAKSTATGQFPWSMRFRFSEHGHLVYRNAVLTDPSSTTGDAPMAPPSVASLGAALQGTTAFGSATAHTKTGALFAAIREQLQNHSSVRPQDGDNITALLEDDIETKVGWDIKVWA